MLKNHMGGPLPHVKESLEPQNWAYFSKLVCGAGPHLGAPKLTYFSKLVCRRQDPSAEPQNWTYFSKLVCRRQDPSAEPQIFSTHGGDPPHVKGP